MLRKRPNLALRGELSLISDFWKQTFESGQQIFGHKYSYSSSHIRRLLEIDIGIHPYPEKLQTEKAKND